jgi:hypothetical protein
MQASGAVQETFRKKFSVPVRGFLVLSIDQRVPFHRSASVRCPALPKA